ncbi:MAG: hypothetical protein O3C62_07995 [Actinomycetota bacterium]|nr:hypothetical protein [Actinomycetota bacterium]MDA2971718.1 hypothetical protein [Actinomycetota bacterium]MDA3001605.1 hypothetical protein [Actinomycetota bacterium]
MNLDEYLSKSSIIDCHGQIAFELVLLLDGEVLVKSRHGSFRVNPRTRVVSPPGRVVPQDVVEQAVVFARSCLS